MPSFWKWPPTRFRGTRGDRAFQLSLGVVLTAAVRPRPSKRRSAPPHAGDLCAERKTECDPLPILRRAAGPSRRMGRGWETGGAGIKLSCKGLQDEEGRRAEQPPRGGVCEPRTRRRVSKYAVARCRRRKISKPAVPQTIRQKKALSRFRGRGSVWGNQPAG